MTPLGLVLRRKSVKSHTAFALHDRPPMALRFLVVWCALGLPLLAHAQAGGGGGGGGGGTSGGGNCSGMMTGSIGLAVPQADGTFLTIPSTQVTSGVFGRAECDCASAAGNPDLNLEIKLTTPFPASSSGVVDIWVGDSSCTNATTRTSSSNTTCQKIASPSVQDFTINSNATSGGGLHYTLKADALSNPDPSNPAKHICDPNLGALPTPSNSVYLFVYNDPNSPLATCTLTLSERLVGPDKVTNPSAAGGDSAVTLNWTAPGPGVNAPAFFQILCADDCGNPIADSPSASQIYSVCINGMLSRRNLTSGGPSSSGGTDAGVGTSTDMALMSLRTDVGERLPWQPNVALCPADMGTNSTADGGIFGPGSTSALTNLDPSYICSSQLSPSTTSARIGGLTNGQGYHFVVLSVDAFGNATPSDRIDGTAQPTEDLWRRYRDAGGGAGGCFIATAAFGSYENRWVWVLRDFRDQVLLEHASGRSFVEWYYAHSPRAATWIAVHGWARALARDGAGTGHRRRLVLALRAALAAGAGRDAARRPSGAQAPAAHCPAGERHVKRAASAIAALALVLAAVGAHADEGLGGSPPRFGENAPHNYQSSQHFAVELKFGPYSPNIDASPGLNGRTPFADLFPPNSGKTRPPGKLLTQVEFDYQFLHRWFGNFGIGHTVGFYRRTTHSFAYNTDPTTGNQMQPCNNQVAMNSCTRSGDTTALNVVPLSIVGVYRFDYLAQRWKIPFVPYFKIGLAYYIWWIENGSGLDRAVHAARLDVEPKWLGRHLRLGHEPRRRLPARRDRPVGGQGHRRRARHQPHLPVLRVPLRRHHRLRRRQQDELVGHDAQRRPLLRVLDVCVGCASS